MPHILIKTMAEKWELNDEDKRSIFNRLESTKLVERVYQEVLAKVGEQSCFKSLRNIGKHEIANVTETSMQSRTEKEQKARLCYSKINVLTAAVGEALRNIIEEEFKNPSVRNAVKEQVLKYMKEKQCSALSPHSLHKNNVSGIKAELETKDEGEHFDKFSKSTFESNCEDSVSGEFFSDDSSDSVSSVHTSDLSSFDDEISISSDEEAGRKRKRISLQFAQEKIENNKLLGECEERPPREKMNISDTTCHETPLSDSDGLAQKSLPPRVRKPNSKYASNYVISPFNVKQKDVGKMRKWMNGNSAISSAKKSSLLPRKIGRPRKNPPD